MKYMITGDHTSEMFEAANDLEAQRSAIRNEKITGKRKLYRIMEVGFEIEMKKENE